uniref:DNA 3'-5' helicase n=1 Tax=Palpitomonas bilix TaxID=652834 RepID=A0A7S3GDR0_9EUKA|mmetsp:Transcript_4505/g.9304  ORF Transcript_4505/g.9304 Transcript_4505/m.9304 type:complete len:823 (+) Transcript_4505:239-2707(+)
MRDAVRLDSDQHSAVQYDGNEPLVILAPAGSGKTSTLTQRVVHLLQKDETEGEAKGQILVLTFTRKAGEELQDRVWKLMQKEGYKKRVLDRISACNFHQYALRTLRSHYREAGMRLPPTVITGDKQRFLVWQALQSLGEELQDSLYAGVELDTSSSSNVDELNEIVLEGVVEDYNGSLAMPPKGSREEDKTENRVRIRSAMTLLSRHSEGDVRPSQVRGFNEFLFAYSNLKSRFGFIDFNDFIPSLLRALSAPAVQQTMAKDLKHILVDEFQDTGKNQLHFVCELRRLTRRCSLTVVGDQNQRIYSFRGAPFDAFKEIKHLYPHAHVVQLLTNYRSCTGVVAISQALIMHNTQHYAMKAVRSASSEEGTVATHILPSAHRTCEFILSHARNARSVAVLCRTNYQCKAIVSRLKDMGADCEHVVGSEKKKGGEKRKKTGQTEVLSAGQFLLVVIGSSLVSSSSEVVDALCMCVRDLKAAAKRKIEQALDGCDAPASTLHAMLSKNGFRAGVKVLAKPVLQRLLPWLEFAMEAKDEGKEKGVRSAAMRLYCRVCSHFGIEAGDDVGKLAEHKAGHNVEGSNSASLESFLSSLSSSSLSGDSGNTTVRVMTIHQAKGLEFDRVFLPFFSAGSVPMCEYVHNEGREEAKGDEKNSGGGDGMTARDVLEEERRLAYVAMTRARSVLYILPCLQDIEGAPTSPSPFLSEMEASSLPPAGRRHDGRKTEVPHPPVISRGEGERCGGQNGGHAAEEGEGIPLHLSSPLDNSVHETTVGQVGEEGYPSSQPVKNTRRSEGRDLNIERLESMAKPLQNAFSVFLPRYSQFHS